MISEFVFKLFGGIGPVDRFSRLVIIGDVLAERGFEGMRAGKVIGLQVFALQHAEPDFELIEPGGIGRQPEHLKMHSLVTGNCLFTQPALQLFGSVGRAIVQDERHGVDLATKRFRNDHLLHEGLEIDKTLPTAADPVDLCIGDGESGKQVAGAATMIACFVQHGLARLCWARELFTLARLHGGFLIQTEQPDACLQEGTRLTIGVEHRTGALQEGDGIMDMLPGMIAPGADTFGGSAIAPLCWPRCAEGWDLGPRDGPIRRDSSARAAPGIAWASYKRWR